MKPRLCNTTLSLALAAAAAAGCSGGAAVASNPRSPSTRSRKIANCTAAAAWGYLDGEDPYSWGADFVITQPQELLTVLA